MRWNESKNNNFQVKSPNSSLTKRDSESFPTSVVWSTWAPMKVGFFVKEVTLGRILTLN